MTYYAGVGSRKTPERVLKLMEQIGSYLARKGYTLRSGAAHGADAAFEKGCDLANGAKEIYLPSAGFNGHPPAFYGVSQAARDLAARFHPRFEHLDPFDQLLIARDGYQVLGKDLNSPSKFVVCWTPKARITGGTGQALRIADAFKVPVINLGDPLQETKALQWMVLNLDFLQDTMYSLFD